MTELAWHWYKSKFLLQMQWIAPGAPLITSATNTSRVGWTTMSPDFSWSLASTGAGASVATAREALGAVASPARLNIDTDWVQDRSKDMEEYTGATRVPREVPMNLSSSRNIFPSANFGLHQNIHFVGR